MCSRSNFFRLLIGIVCCNLVESWSDIQFVGVNNSNQGVIVTAAKVNRIKRTAAYSLNGSVRFNEDFSNAYDMMLYYSRIGNNQFIKLPLGYDRTPLCAFCDGLYRRKFSPIFEKCTDLPKAVEGQQLCPLYVKGNYTLPDCVFDGVDVATFLPSGLYRLQFMIFKSKSNKVSSQFSIDAKLL